MNAGATWDDVFGDLDVRTLDHDERLDLINAEIERTLRGKTWAALAAGDEGALAWDAAIRTFLDGIWVACIFCCHAVCEREVAGVVTTAIQAVNSKLPKHLERAGLGKLTSEAERLNLLPPDLTGALQRLAEIRKPYGHWRSYLDDESLQQRVMAEHRETGNADRNNLVERLLVRDATHAMLTTIRLYFGSYSFGGP